MQEFRTSFDSPIGELLRATWFARVLRRIERAGESAFRNSRVMSLVTSLSRHANTNAGFVLIAGAATHVVLLLLNGRPAGWLWIVPPALVAASGALLTMRRHVSDTPR
jgi:hypothetical protein